MKVLPRLLRFGVTALLSLFVIGVLGTAGAYFYMAPDLPSIEKLRDGQLQVPLRIYSADGALIAEYGEKRRKPLTYEQFPKEMVQAILAAEDDRFFEHPGVDYQGLIRAAVQLILTGEKRQGGSTITMQVARNFFLSREKTYIRKVREIFLALKIESQLSKEQILELYLNKIYLGHRSYGVAAAAQVYYAKELSELGVPEFAMIAGLPKAPSRYNPIVNSPRALSRRNYVLGRMHELGFIDADTYRQAVQAPVSAERHTRSPELEAPYVAEMVRAKVVERFGREEAYSTGLNVYTTVDSRLQRSANEALREGLLNYDRRHGWRGPLKQVELPEDGGAEQWDKLLGDTPSVGHLVPALIVTVGEKQAQAYIGKPEPVEIDWEGLKWARPYIDENRRGPEPESAGEIVNPGDIVLLEARDDDGWTLAEPPEVEGALVSLRPRDGRVLALAGGFDYYQSKFNRVTQARRQPGSNFKPFVYSSALANGLTPATLINDAPVVFEDSALESAWRPENYSGRFFGPTRLRKALVRSRNLVSIRVLRRVGIGPTIGHVEKFGFDRKHLPRDLSLALGSASLAPLEVVHGYAVFANGGFLIEPYLIKRIEKKEGEILFEADPVVACPECANESKEQGENEPKEKEEAEVKPVTAEYVPEPALEPVFRPAPRTVDPANVYLMTTMMQDVIRRGTGRRALRLGRNDLAGKTGTTNEQRDAWFSGFNPAVVTTAWVGFDTPRPLGRRETGAGAALPIWIDYMEDALKGVPEYTLEQPPGLVTVRIDPETGLVANGDNPDAIFETFRAGNVPKSASPTKAENDGSGESTEPYAEQLF